MRVLSNASKNEIIMQCALKTYNFLSTIYKLITLAKN